MTPRIFAAVLSLWSFMAAAGTDQVLAPSRSNGDNFKDRAMASCLARAWPDTPAGRDAGKTASMLLEWAQYDLAADEAVDALIAQYLARDYNNPFEGYRDARFALLKCQDLYHSAALQKLVRKYVKHPDWVGDKPRTTRVTPPGKSR